MAPKRKKTSQDGKRTSDSKKAKPAVESHSEPVAPTTAARLPECRYGSQCYQKNWKHRQKYAHGESHTADKTVELSESNNVGTKREEETSASSSAGDVREKIQEVFLADMPEDFYQLWEFCRSLDGSSPQTALKEILDLELVGPFELLRQAATSPQELEELLVKWRYYYDPPEFQTVLKGDEGTGLHVGYFRDDPKEPPAFVASNVENEGAALTILGDNLFAAIHEIITQKLSTADSDDCVKLEQLKTKLVGFARDGGFDLSRNSKRIKDRQKNIVAKTFYGVGIVVPYNKKTQVGYRDVIQSPASFKKILADIVRSKSEAEIERNLEPLEEYVSSVQLANDECDWGAGLELGLDLLAFGGEVFHPMLLGVLSVTYNLLERQQFLTILQAHLERRRKLAGAPK